ncbi:MAG: WGR domain-containing protein [Myxococcales bacterium]|nr:WGR domain-containing protein [Myxococcales bacterium]
MRRFEYRDDKSAKFWSVAVSGATMTVSYGRIGSDGQTKRKDFDDEAKANAEAEKLIGQKVKKGYVETDGGAAAAAAQTAIETPSKTKTKATPKTKTKTKTKSRLAPLQLTAQVEPRQLHYGLVLGLGVSGKRVAAVGGQGSDLFYLSATGGKYSKKKSPGPGLRSAYLDGDTLWVCGEYGYVAKSPDRGKTWTRIDTGARACLFGIVADDAGHIWTAGDAGFLAVSHDGETFRKVGGVAQYIARISNSPLGILVPTDKPGYLYIVNDKSVERCKGLKAGQDLMYACVTEAGSLVVVGLSGQIYRSTDRGKTFETIKCPVKGHLTGIDILADGRLVAVGDRGAVLVSDDDGASFKKLKHGLTSDMLWCCKAHGDGMVIGGAQGTIFYLAAAEKA